MTPFEWAYLIVMLIGVAYAATHQPKTPTPVALTLDDVKAPVVEVGKTIPVLFGTRDIEDPMVVWYGNLRTVPVKTSSGK
jgi:hypothetical protein